MTRKSRLYKETLLRVGPDTMRGIDNLLEEGYTGVAEKHTVSKLMMYVKELEERLGINIPDPDHAPVRTDAIKINDRGVAHYISI